MAADSFIGKRRAATKMKHNGLELIELRGPRARWNGNGITLVTVVGIFMNHTMTWRAGWQYQLTKPIMRPGRGFRDTRLFGGLTQARAWVYFRPPS